MLPVVVVVVVMVVVAAAAVAAVFYLWTANLTTSVAQITTRRIVRKIN